VYAEVPITRQNIDRTHNHCRNILRNVLLQLTVFNVESNYVSTTMEVCSNI